MPEKSAKLVWSSKLNKFKIKGDEENDSLAREFNHLCRELDIKPKEEFDKFFQEEYLPWTKNRKTVKLNQDVYKEIYKYFEGSDLDFVQIRKDNLQIVAIPLEIHLDLITDKNKKLKHLKNFL